MQIKKVLLKEISIYIVCFFAALAAGIFIAILCKIGMKNDVNKYFSVNESGILSLAPEYISDDTLDSIKHPDKEEFDLIEKYADDSDLTKEEYLFANYMITEGVSSKYIEDVSSYIPELEKTYGMKFSDLYEQTLNKDIYTKLYVKIKASKNLSGELPDVLVVPDHIGKINIVEISDYAFLNSKITSITLPESVQKIGNNAFEGCTELTSFTTLNKDVLYGNDVFINCNKLN